MSTTRLALALLCLLSSHAIGGTLSATEAESLRAEIAAMMASFERGDAEALIAKTHPSLANLLGGQEVFEQAARHGVEQLRQTGVKFLSAEVGAPPRPIRREARRCASCREFPWLKCKERR